MTKSKKLALAEELKTMPQFRPTKTKDNETTVREMMVLLSQDGETWSYAKVKTRLDRMADDGKLRKRKQGNSTVYVMVE